ncbi:hypothetical protein MNL02_00690 [Bartonella krasnovii]|uniref:hypothetical protein n=1 Tax=Bartonella krasnovii TaxID=2267275 RepID=UPI001F4C54A4|nr:hypothetical protein [Bartonella krasnovii]UNF52255.1 hypothetical protein MNL02_00690 [Bartonella krasnovii]
MTIVCYIVGGGINFTMTDNALLHTQHRHLDFGKKQFAKDYLRRGYKINDFRVGALTSFNFVERAIMNTKY